VCVPVTLAQAQVNVQQDIDYSVIDNLRRYSWLLDQIVFDDTVNPGTGGATLTYGYTRLTAAAPAGFRAYNQEFVPGQAARQRFTVDLKPLGGAFTVDRDLADLGGAGSNEVTFQLQQMLTSIRTRFAQEVILGDVAVDATGFDGLSKALVGTTTERSAGAAPFNSAPAGTTAGDWTSVVAASGTGGPVAAANFFLDELDFLLSNIVPSHVGGGDQGAPGALEVGVKALLGNTRAVMRLRALARYAGMYTSEKDDLGRQIERYGPWVLVDIGDRPDGSAPIIPLSGTSTTDVYAVTFGLDSFHAASKSGVPLVRSWLPDFSTAGAVKSGESEMGPLAMCLKNTKSSAVLRGVKV
jgi:hypothetical protein